MVLDKKTVPYGQHQASLAATYMRLASLLTREPRILAEIQDCMLDARGYVQRHGDELIEDLVGDLDLDDMEAVRWIAFRKILTDNHVMWEFDWKEGLSEFVYRMSLIAKPYGLEVDEHWFDASQDIPMWTTELNRRWRGTGQYVVQFDTDSDSYLLSVCDKASFAELQQLGRKLDLPVRL